MSKMGKILTVHNVAMTIIVAILVSLIAIIVISFPVVNNFYEECKAKNGVVVREYVCIKKDAVIEVR